MKLTIECHPETFEILSDHYDRITPIMDRLSYSFDNYMADILVEEAERIREENKGAG